MVSIIEEHNNLAPKENIRWTQLFKKGRLAVGPVLKLLLDKDCKPSTSSSLPLPLPDPGPRTRIPGTPRANRQRNA